jgi:hypothetical protein
MVDSYLHPLLLLHPDIPTYPHWKKSWGNTTMLKKQLEDYSRDRRKKKR